MSLAILGLFSFGWPDERVPERSDAICREVGSAEAHCAAADGVSGTAAPAIPKADAPKFCDGDSSPSTVVRPHHSVCIGICAGGDVWAVACGA